LPDAPEVPDDPLDKPTTGDWKLAVENEAAARAARMAEQRRLREMAALPSELRMYALALV
jgi:hypothetical protein